MSSSTIETLHFVSQQIIIYTGIPTLFAGILGNLLNIIVFLSLNTFRESSCAFYLTVRSLMNLGQLMPGLLSRIMISGFDTDWTQTSLSYCKCRPFIIYFTALMSATCLCLATIDQYLATCSRVRWQRWNDIKVAQRLIAFFFVVWLAEQIPTLIFYNQTYSTASNRTVCVITDSHFALFNNYFTIYALWFILPLLMTILFASMAFRNVQQIAYRTIPLVRRELDKQLTVMVLLEVLLNCLTVAPNIITYTLIFTNGFRDQPIIMARISFVYTISLWLYYLYFAVCFTSFLFFS